MPSLISHGLLAYGVTRLPARQGEKSELLLKAALIVSVLPDIDGVFMRWIPYGHTFGHRGFAHGLLFALLSGLAATFICRRCRKWFPGGAWGLGTLFVLLAASHGFFDALTDGGLGIGFLSPFSNQRYFFAWTPIPVAQLSPYYYFRYPRLIAGLLAEAAMFWPVSLALPVLRSRLKRPWHVVAACVLAAVSIAAWAARM